MGSAQCFKKHLPSTEIQSRPDFHRWKCIVANTWQYFTLITDCICRPHQETWQQKPSKSFSQTGACTSLGFILKQAHCSSAQKTLSMHQCRREETISQVHVQGANWVLKKGRNPLGQAWLLLHLPESHPTHCDDPVWALWSYGLKSFGALISTSIVCATCGCVGLEKYLWKGFWRSKNFSLSCGVTVKVFSTVNFLTGCFHLLLMRDVYWYWSLWVRFLQRAQEAENRKDDSLPELNKFPSWTSAHVVMPQVLGLAYNCFHEGKVKTTAIQETNAGANIHPAYGHTFPLCPSIFFSLYPKYLRHLKMSRSNSWNVGREKISSLLCKKRSPSSSVRLHGEIWLWDRWLSHC